MKPPTVAVGGWQLTIAAALSIFLTLTPGLPTLAFAQNPDNELSQDIAKLDSFLSNRDLASLEATINKDSVKWQERDRPSFIVYMSKACSLLSSYDIGDLSKRASLLSRYAISLLMSGDLALHDHVQFVSFLMFDPMVIDEAAWRALREKKAQLWLAARRRVESSIDPTFDFDDLPFINVPTPKGSGARAGSSPESIKEPKLRAEYKAAIARNSEKIRRSNDQLWLKQNAPDFYKNVERYLVNAYSRPPAWDSFGTVSPNPLNIGGFNTTCTPANTGPCGLTTNANGQFNEQALSVCATACRSNGVCVTGGPSVVGQTWHVGSGAITQTISYYCQRVLVNGQ